MEIQEKKPADEAGGSAQAVLIGRLKHLIGAQPAVFGLLLVLLSWVGIHAPGLGRHGLWDPWEMDRAHVARQMVGPPRVLVVEKRGDDGELGAIASWLDARYRDGILLSTPSEAGRTQAVTAATLLAKANTQLDRDVFHLVFVDLMSVAPDPGAHVQVEELASWLEGVRSRNPGLEVVLLQPLPDTQSPNAQDASRWLATFRQTYAESRVELSARELSGQSWGKPGAFRRELVKLGKYARDGGYNLVPGLETPGEGSFADRGFWKAAEKRKLDARLIAPVSPDITASLLEQPEFALPEAVLAWPRDADHAAVVADFESGGSAAPSAAREAVASVEARVDEALSRPWLRAQFKMDGITRSVPPLDYWLMAGSFDLLGFSELASRLPAFLMGLLALLVAFRAAQLTFGPLAATFTGIVLVTSPLFFAQARSVAGEMSGTLSLTLIASGMLLTARRGERSQAPFWMVFFGGLIGFLGQGLYGLLVPTVVAVAFLLAARTSRLAVLAPTLLLVIGSAAAWALVAAGDGWTFWDHFSLEVPLFSWELKPEDRPVFLNFDRLVRQIGFGMLPWVALLPFGLAFLVAVQGREPTQDLDIKRKRAALLFVAMWFFVPYVVQSMVLKQNNHLVFPAIPAAAMAIALLLTRLVRGRGLGAVVGIAGAIAIGLLLSNAKKSPEPLTSFLTADPPLVGIKEKSDYPEALKLPTLLKLSLMAIAGLMLLHAARLGTRIRLVAAFFTRPKPVAITLTALMVALFALLLGGLEAQIAQSFTSRAGQTLEVIHRFYVRDAFYWRPHLWALYAILAGSLMLYVAVHTRLLQRAWGWCRTWVFTSTMARFGALLLAVAAFGVGLGVHLHPSEFVSEAFAGLPTALMILGVAAWVVLALFARFASGAAAAWSARPVVGGLFLPLGGSVLAVGGLVLGLVIAGWNTASALGDVKEALDASTTITMLGSAAIVLLILPPLASLLAPRLSGVGRRIRGGVGRAWSRLPLSRDSLRFDVLHIGLIWVLLILAIVLTLAFGTFPDGFVVWATVSSPLFIGGLVAIAGLAMLLVVARRRSDGLLAPLADRRTAIVALGLLVGWILAGLFAQLFAESGLRNVDFLVLPEPRSAEAAALRVRGYIVGNLVLAAGLLTLNLLWSRMKQRAGAAWTVMLVSGVGAGLILLVALAGKWLHLEGAVQGADAEPFLPYLFLKSRRTLLLYALIVAVIGLGVGGRIPGLVRRIEGLTRLDRGVRRTLVAARRPVPTAVWVLLGVSLLTAGATAAWGMLLVPVLVVGIALSPLARAPEQTEPNTGALTVRGLVQILPAALVAVVPALVEMGLGNQHADTLLWHGIVLTIVLVLLWAGAVAMRLGLGLDDVISGISVATPAAALIGGLTLLDQARFGSLDGATTAQLGIIGLGGLLLFALAVTQASRWVPPLRVVELLERPRVFVVALSLTVAAFAFFYNQRLVTAFSFHVSQKHILETVRLAEEGELPTGRLFQHGLSGQSSRNFYTSDIPEVRDATIALQALLGTKDTLLPLTRAGGSVTTHRVVPGFAAENDPGSDGTRDWSATTGLLTAQDPEHNSVTDADASWRPNQWAGHVLYDSAGWRFPVVSNTATGLVYDPSAATPPAGTAARPDAPAPAFTSGGGPKNVYRIDHPDAPRHDATAMVSDRLYFLLPKVGGGAPGYTDKGSFSSLNHQFRKLSGRHLAVLDDRSSRILLATSELRPGEEDKNWLRKAIITPEQFQARAARGHMRGIDPKNPMGGMLTWENSIKLLGWSMDNYSVSKGKEFELTLFFQAVKPIDTSYKVFVHADRAGHRIHTDHWILAVSKGDDGKHCIGCFQTDHWMPGDIIVDTYRRDVPYGAPSGETDIWLGLFNPNGDKRAKITAWNDDLVKYNGSDNRPSIGSFIVR